MSDLQKFFKEHKQEIVALGKKHGCTFTEDDVMAIADGQLSEEQLGEVHGGGTGVGNPGLPTYVPRIKY